MYLIYFYLNLFCWYMMKQHVDSVNTLRLGYSYRDIKNKMRRKEIICLIGIILVILPLVTFALVSEFHKEKDTKELMGQVQLVILMSLKAIYILLFVIIYNFLKRTLRKNFHFYYQKIKYKLFVLALTNIYFFIVSIMFNVLQYLNLIEKMLETGERYSILLNITYVLLLWSYYLAFFFVIYFNIKNINFKKYLKDVYVGLDIEKHYDGSSIFIVKTCWISETLTSEKASFIKAVESDSDDGDFSYDSDDEEMDLSKKIKKLTEFKSQYNQLHNN